MSDCLFCRIVAGEIPAEVVFQDEQVLVFRDIQPKAEVHLLMVPRVHIESLASLGPEHDSLIAHMCRLLPEVAAAQGLAGGFRTVINTGAGGGQEIPHLHLHLLGGSDLPGF